MATAVSAGQGPSMQARAYDFIKQKITLCQYAPGQLLSEAQLREELGFSRTPVREALGRLQHEGLLEVLPKRGVRIADFSIRDVCMIYEVRMLVEPYVLRTCGSHLDPDELGRYSALFRQHLADAPGTDFFDLDDQFHTMLISALQNDYLRELYQRIQTQNTRVRITSGSRITSRQGDTMQEHLAITDACLAGDWEAAAKAMEHHLENSRKAALDTVLQSKAETETL